MRTPICGHVNPLMITSAMTFQFGTRYKLNASKPANGRRVKEPRQVLNSGVTDQTRSVFTARKWTIMNLWSVWFRKSWATISGGRSINSPRVWRAGWKSRATRKICGSRNLIIRALRSKLRVRRRGRCRRLTMHSGAASAGGPSARLKGTVTRTHSANLQWRVWSPPTTLTASHPLRRRVRSISGFVTHRRHACRVSARCYIDRRCRRNLTDCNTRRFRVERKTKWRRCSKRKARNCVSNRTGWSAHRAEPGGCTDIRCGRTWSPRQVSARSSTVRRSVTGRGRGSGRCSEARSLTTTHTPTARPNRSWRYRRRETWPLILEVSRGALRE